MVSQPKIHSPFYTWNAITVYLGYCSRKVQLLAGAGISGLINYPTNTFVQTSAKYYATACIMQDNTPPRVNNLCACSQARGECKETPSDASVHRNFSTISYQNNHFRCTCPPCFVQGQAEVHPRGCAFCKSISINSVINRDSLTTTVVLLLRASEKNTFKRLLNCKFT